MARNTSEYIRQAFTMQQVAEHYGFEPDRGGFIRCPFHAADRTASLKIYDGSHGFHCFGCGAHGSVIDFVMRLYDLNFKQAVLRIDSDFNLGLYSRKTDNPVISEAVKKRQEEALNERRQAMAYKRMVHEFWQLRETIKIFQPLRSDAGTWYHPLYLDAQRRLPAITNWLDEYLEKGGCTDWVNFQHLLKMTI